MKKIKLSVGLILGIAMLVGVFANTSPASAMTCNSATLTGSVDTGTPPTRARFTYGTNYNTVANGGGAATAVQTYDIKGVYSIQQFISGLSESTTYYYRLEVTNNFGTKNLNIENFTTPACSQPTPTPTPTPTPSLPACRVDYFPADSEYNGQVALNWRTSNSNNVILSGGQFGTGISVEANGTRIVGINSNTLFTITAKGPNCSPEASMSSWMYAENSPAPAPTPTPQPQQPTQPSLQACRVDYFPADSEYDGSVLLNWRTSNSNNVILSGGQYGTGISVEASGSRRISINSNTLFKITAKGPNCSPEASVSSWMYAENVSTPTPHPTPTPTPHPTKPTIFAPNVNIWADNTNIRYNESTTIRWDSSYTTSCNASGGSNNWGGAKALSGSFFTGSLQSTRTFNINCVGQNGQSISDSVTINVGNNNISLRPNVNIWADDTSLEDGDSTRVRWDSTNADRCEASGGSNGWGGSRSTSGSFNTGNLSSDKTYRITCTNDNSGLSETDSVTVNVDRNNDRDNNDEPNVRISADNTNLVFNESTTIRWDVDNADSCRGMDGTNGWSGSKNRLGGRFNTGPLSRTTTFSIECENDEGEDRDSVTVFVNNFVPPTIIQQPPIVIQQPPTIIRVPGQVLGSSTGTSLVLLNSSVDRNQPIVPTLDNTNPCPGDEITYTLNYQNVGTASIKNVILRVDLPLEIDYLYSNVGNAMRSGNSIILNVGTVKANGQGSITIRVRVRDNIPAGTPLNFPAVLTYVDPSGFPQMVTANVSAKVCGTIAPVVQGSALGANIFGAGLFLPGNIFGWLLLLIIILLLVLLFRHLFQKPTYMEPMYRDREPLYRDREPMYRDREPLYREKETIYKSPSL